MKTLIHINQHVLKRNRVCSEREPAVTIKRGGRGKVARAHEAVGRDENGRVMFRVVYRPDNPLPCGAVCWVETELEVSPLITQECKMATTTKPVAAPKPAKPVNHDITVTVKAPADMPAGRVQKALQAALTKGCGCSDPIDDKCKNDLGKLQVGKCKVAPKPAPAAAPAPASTEPVPSLPLEKA